MAEQKVLIFKAVVECRTPLHCGGGPDDVLDQPVARDAFGLWRIPGSSLAGALRSLAERRDEKLARRLFGYQEKDVSSASLVWCEDGLLLDFDGQPALAKRLAGVSPRIRCAPFVRDHVRIGLESGVAAEAGKFDCEIVPAGARFLLEFRCDGWDRPLSPEEEAFFNLLVADIAAGRLPLGGKTGLGYGLYNIVAAEYRHIDLSRPEGMRLWLAHKPHGLPGAGGHAIAPAAAQPSAPGLDGWLEIPLACDHPMLAGGGKPGRPDGSMAEADMVFALTPRLIYDDGKRRGDLVFGPALPSSSLKGVLRHDIFHILCAREAEALAGTVLDEIFGMVSGEDGQCGKLVVADCPLSAAYDPEEFVFEQHVAIDRFSAATIDGALFSEEPFWKPGSRVNLRIRACSLAAHEAALFTHALMDLFEGSLAFGGGVNRGNGRLCLPGWRENPESALAAVRGDLAWNGVRIFENGNALENLARFSPEWDAALTQRLEHE